jgi:murein L,D-transpeptidase YcbB/YkuD
MKFKFAGRPLLGVVLVALVCPLPQRARTQSTIIQMAEYERTLDALERYRALAKEDDAPALPQTSEPVEPGDHYDGVQGLINLLVRLGDLPSGADIEDADIYDGPLVTAVQRFQIRHGLSPSGRIDRTTLKQLNTPLSTRVHQLELALDCWRRNPYDPSRPAIVINLPEFRLRAYREGHLDLELKIVVGKALERETPLLSSQLDAIVFRPYWNVPLRIQREELVPAIAKDRSYIADHDLEIVNEQREVFDGALTRSTLAQLQAGTLHLRQVPGPKNSLGLVKFSFPNPYGVYMHDTPVQSAFYRQRRDLSHGCIRVEKAEDLAEWVMQDEPDWPRDRIDDAMHGSDSFAVKLTQPIQVVTMYLTAVVLENGEVHFCDDIYGGDKSIARAPTLRQPHQSTNGPSAAVSHVR